MRNPFAVLEQFEEALSEYTGAPHVVTTDSCTNAIFLSLLWHFQRIQGELEKTKFEISKCPAERKLIDLLDKQQSLERQLRGPFTIPLRTYLSVPQAILRTFGFRVPWPGMYLKFEDREWTGAYQIKPTPVWDAAKMLTSNMYIPHTMMCLSFHHKKILSIGKGGAILLDDPKGADWLRKARYEGRTPGENYWNDDIEFIGYNHYMQPEQAARGLLLLSNLPRHNEPQIEPEPGYRPLTEFSLFKNCEILT